MDEQDFAELISVFLQGEKRESGDENATGEETQAEAEAEEAKLSKARKTIIEALAERAERRVAKRAAKEGELAEAAATEGPSPEASAREPGEETPAQREAVALVEEVLKSARAESEAHELEPEVGPEVVKVEVEAEAVQAEPVRPQPPENEKPSVEAQRPVAESLRAEAPQAMPQAPTASPEVQRPSAEAPRVEKPAQAPRPTYALRDLLARIASQEGVIAALVVGADGFLIEAVGTGLDREGTGAVLSTSFHALRAIGRQLARGELRHALLEYDAGMVFIAPLREEATLIVIASEPVLPGRLRWEIKRFGPQLSRSLQS